MAISAAVSGTILSTPVWKFGNIMPASFSLNEVGGLLGKIATWSALALADAAAGGRLQLTPDIMLHVFPLYAVQNIEVAKSDKLLNFRSIGGHFMAFQEGDNMSIRIDIRIDGPTRFLWLHALEQLYLRGTATFKRRPVEDRTPKSETGRTLLQGTVDNAIGSNGIIIPQVVQSAVTYTTGPSGAILQNIGGPVQLGSYGGNPLYQLKTSQKVTGASDVTLTADKFRSGTYFKETGKMVRNERILMHKTFDVICEEEIFREMFIQTLIWRKNVAENGKDGITVHLLLRRFIEPPKRFLLETSESKTTLIKRYNVRGINTADTSIKFDDQGKPYTSGGETGRAIKELLSEGVATGFTEDEVADMLEKEEEAIKESIVKQSIDVYGSTQVAHFYTGTVPDDRASGEKMLSRINFYWRLGWTSYYMWQFGLGKLISSDPIASRLFGISNMVNQSIFGPTNTTAISECKDVDTIVPPSYLPDNSKPAGYLLTQEMKYTSSTTATRYSTESKYDFSSKVGEASKHLTDRGREMLVLLKFGISLEYDESLQDVFVVSPQNRQEIFEQMLYKGITICSVYGDVMQDGSLKVSLPYSCEFKFEMFSSSYQSPFHVMFVRGNRELDIEEGIVYFIGNNDSVPIWTSYNDGDFYSIDKPVLEETYMYVHSIKLTDDYAGIKVFFIHPRYGI